LTIRITFDEGYTLRYLLHTERGALRTPEPLRLIMDLTNINSGSDEYTSTPPLAVGLLLLPPLLFTNPSFIIRYLKLNPNCKQPSINVRFGIFVAKEVQVVAF
jgi:hypothetical protein